MNKTSFLVGQKVILNPKWMNHEYLKREFGDRFPSRIIEINDDVVTVGTKQNPIQFAAHVLV